MSYLFSRVSRRRPLRDLTARKLPPKRRRQLLFESLEDRRVLAVTVGATIEGINFNEVSTNNANGFYHIPPDPIGAVGTSHVVSVVNTSIEWHTKAGVQEHSESLKAFFSPLATVNNTFDPKVIYDQHANRFVVITLEKTDDNDGSTSGDAADTSRILIAVSDDSDPNGTWRFQAINSKVNVSGTDTWADYPGLAIDEEAIYITNNMFTFGPTNAFLASRLWIVDKTGGGGGIYGGGTSPVTIHDPSTAAGLGIQNSTLQPAHIFGTPSSSTLGTFLVNTGELGIRW